MALAEFDASRCEGDFGYDEAHHCRWACEGHRYRFVIEPIAPELAQISKLNTVPCDRDPVITSTEICSTHPPADQRRKWSRSSPGQRGSRLGIEGGGYCRDHLRALAQRAEVADREVRIIGSKAPCLSRLLPLPE
jgi:hypothetical protein